MNATESATLDRVRARLADMGASATAPDVAAALRAEGQLVGDVGVLDVLDALQRDSQGAGCLDPLLCIEGVTDIVVNGPHAVYVDSGAGLVQTEVTFDDDEAVRRLAQRLAATAGRRLDDACPYVDLRLPDGTRFHAVLATLARPGTCLSLRVPARRTLTLDELVTVGTVSDIARALLRDVVTEGLSFVVTGGTGTGKTTLLNALLSSADPDERIVIVEDARELRPCHRHVVSLETRQANVEGAGEVTLRSLVRQALRMRPDRLVVGEVRGAEVVDLLAALNTGHDGGCSTVHANSAGDVPARFEALGVAAGLPRAAVHAQLAAALDVVVHLRRGRDGVRRLDEIGVIECDQTGLVSVTRAVRFDDTGTPTLGHGARRLDDLLASRSRR